MEEVVDCLEEAVVVDCLEEAVVDLSSLATVPRSISVLEGGAVMAVSPRQGEEGKRFDSREVVLAAGQAKIFNFVPKF